MEKIIIDTVSAWQLEAGDTFDLEGEEVTIKTIDDNGSVVFGTDSEGEDFELLADERVHLLGFE
jgi:hypothetical protein